jgi:hypothetical protein
MALKNSIAATHHESVLSGTSEDMLVSLTDDADNEETEFRQKKTGPVLWSLLRNVWYAAV